MVQLFVPLAVPDPPLELAHVTKATPTLSFAVPCITNELADVAKLVVAGDKIVIDGGVVSGPGVGFAGVGLGAGLVGVGFVGVGLVGVGPGIGLVGVGVGAGFGGVGLVGVGGSDGTPGCGCPSCAAYSCKIALMSSCDSPLAW